MDYERLALAKLDWLKHGLLIGSLIIASDTAIRPFHRHTLSLITVV